MARSYDPASVTENRAAERKIVEAFSTGDLSRVESLFALDYVDHQGLGGHEMIGPSGFSDVVRAARTGYVDLAVRIDDLIAEGDKVVARLHWRGVRPAGEIVERETIEILRFVAGRAVEHWGARAKG